MKFCEVKGGSVSGRFRFWVFSLGLLIVSTYTYGYGFDGLLVGKIQHPNPSKLRHSLKGKTEFDYNYFYRSSFFPNQKNAQNSVMFNGEYRLSSGKILFVFNPFFRYDIIDSYRTHADVREFFISLNQGNLSLNAGIRKYSWTNYPGFSLTNFINRVDFKESPLSMERLGQPGIDCGYTFREFIKVEAFLFPYYRNIVYPDYESRLMFSPLPIDNENILFEGENGQLYPEFAVRNRINLKKLEFTLGYFHGYNRTTDFFPAQDFSTLQQKNSIINLISFEYQQVIKGVILRNELVAYKSSDGSSYYGFHPGLEYTLTNPFSSRSELLISVEYLYDQQKKEINLPFGNNWMGLFRLDFGDLSGTVLQIRVITNASDYDTFSDVELSRRLSGNFKASINGNFTVGEINKTNPLYVYQHSTSIGGKLGFYF